MAADPVFVDTNVLVYLTRPKSGHHIAAKAVLTRFEEEGAKLWVSTQILREYLAVVTRPQASAAALPMRTAIADVRGFCAAFEVADANLAVFGRLLDLLAARPGAGRQVHDANIVATMLVYGVRRLVPFNPADFRRFGREIELVPVP